MRIIDWSSVVCSSDLMDEYERLVFPSIERGECIADQLLPFRAGIGGNPVLRQRADRRHDVIVRHQHAARNRGMPSKCVEAPLQHWFAAERCQLLWPAETRTRSPAAGKQHDRNWRDRGRGGLAHLTRRLAQPRLAGKPLSVYGLLKF